MILVGISPYIIRITTKQQGFGSLGHCLLQRRGVQTGFAHKRLVNVGHILRHGHMQFAGGFFSIFWRLVVHQFDHLIHEILKIGYINLMICIIPASMIYIYSNLQNDTNNSICHIPIIPITWFLPISFLTIPSTKFDFPKIKTVSLQPRPQGFRIWIIL